MTVSYASGPSDHPLLYQTIGDAFDEVARRHGDREAIVALHQGERLTFRQLSAKVNAFASGLLQLGLEPGDRIGIWSPNRLEWVIAQIASAKAGLILVNINPAYRAEELEYCLNKVECSALVLASDFRGHDYLATMNELGFSPHADTPGNVCVGRVPSLEWLIVMADAPPHGYLAFSDIAAMATTESDAVLAALVHRLQPEDPINIQFTCGTTGIPKGAILSHHNILNNAFFSGRRMQLTPVDRLCIPVLLYHCFGMVLGVLTCVTHGACMVLPGEAFDAGQVLAAIERERCTALHGVPTMFIAQLAHPDFARHDLSSLRTGIMSGAPCPVEVMTRVVEAMHMREITIGYGMTEVSPLSFQTLPADSLAHRVATVGRVHDHVEAKIVGPDGRTVPVGEPGEILFRGYSVMSGYWGDEDLSAEVLGGGGWIRSGDLATMDQDGYVRVTGRAKDIIIRGGEKIFPGEIEALLRTHPDIDEAHIFGVPHPHYGEEVCVWLRTGNARLTASDVQDHCRGRIAYFKIPAIVHFVSDFPMTSTGKIQKSAMRQAVMARNTALGREMP
ncbi:AMP-binding protein [Sphingobium sp. Sx8-8]|uniref:AMP-binding protein n=1 Tax=Sphingobium sp. Sx8-8 TaxID=2933617 RepID=UPI001F5AA21C|nr:AMP-binding protein [Sphingobium sp. Sx8-8]